MSERGKKDATQKRKYYSDCNDSDESDKSDYRRSERSNRTPADTPPRRNEESRLERLERLVEALVKRSSSEGLSTREKCISFAVRSDCIPTFEPGNPNLTATKWVDKIEQLADINNWSDRETIYHMQNRLCGLAKKWYSNLSSYDRSWTEWKELIKKSFPDHNDFASTLRKLVNRAKKGDENMTEYYFAKMELIEACKITGKNAVSCLIDGISDVTVQTGARAGRYSTPEALFSEFLSTVSENTRPSTSGKEKGHNIERKAVKSRRFESTNNTKQSSFLKCFNCSERGHIYSQCKKVKLECIKCKRLGHNAENCNRKDGKSLKHIMNCEVSKSLPNTCYFVNCLINNESVRAYIDTGCRVVTIRESDAQKLKLKVKQCAIVVTGYGGGWTKTLGKAKVEMKVDLAEAEVEVLVVKDCVQSVPVLIGQTFLNDPNVTVVIRNSAVRVLNKELITLPEVDSLPPVKILM